MYWEFCYIAKTAASTTSQWDWYGCISGRSLTNVRYTIYIWAYTYLKIYIKVYTLFIQASSASAYIGLLKCYMKIWKYNQHTYFVLLKYVYTYIYVCIYSTYNKERLCYRHIILSFTCMHMVCVVLCVY